MAGAAPMACAARATLPAMSEIRMNLDLLSGEITERHARQFPEVFERYGPIGKIRCREDARFHLVYLAAALDTDIPAFFLDYVGWARVMLASRKIPPEDLARNLRILDEVLRDRLTPETAGRAGAMIAAALEQLPSMSDDVPSFLRGDSSAIARKYLDHLLAGDRRAATKTVETAMDNGLTPREVYRDIFEPVQKEVGRLWQLNRLTVAQEHFCTAATQHVMTQLYSRLFTDAPSTRTLVSMCVGGEMHEVGLRIVTDLLEIEGWQTFYLGANVPPADAIRMCVDRKADVLLVSATITPHIPAVAELVRLFRAEPALSRSRVIVGGRAFTVDPDLWRRLGADGYAANADDCIELLHRIA